MNILKLTGTAMLAVTLATTSFAGTLTEPDIIEIEEAAKGSSASSGSSGVWLPLLALAIVVAVIASDDGDAAGGGDGGGGIATGN